MHKNVKLYKESGESRRCVYKELCFRVTQVGLRGLQRNRRHTRSKWNRCKSRLSLPMLPHSVVSLGIPPPRIQSWVCSLFIVSYLLSSFRVLWIFEWQKEKGYTRVVCERVVYIFFFRFFLFHFIGVSGHCISHFIQF